MNAFLLLVLLVVISPQRDPAEEEGDAEWFRRHKVATVLLPWTSVEDCHRYLANPAPFIPGRNVNRVLETQCLNEKGELVMPLPPTETQL